METFHFHSHVQIISRGKGKSAVAAAAYRAGEIITNEYDGITHNYTRKGGVVHIEILLPGNAPSEYADRAVLWNAVEKIEKAENSQLAREFDIALPTMFTLEQNVALARKYVKQTFVSAGMCADLCVHDKGDGNPHCHIMLTVRPINKDGTWGSKQKKEYILDDNGDKIYDTKKRSYKCRSVPSTDWNDRGNADKWRKAWEEIANAELERFGFETRIDRRTYAEQGIDKIPTVHMGVAAMQMEERGICTGRGDVNREIEITNKEIRQLRARINKLAHWITEESVSLKPPTLADVIADILNQQGRSGISRLKAASQMLIFLQENEIYDISGLDKKVNAIHGKFNSVSADLKKVNRRIDTLKEHLRHSENYKEYRALKQKYDRLYSEYTTACKETGFFAERKAQKALDTANSFYEANRAELILFSAAEKYLRGVLQGRFDPKKLPPIAMWERELDSKTEERNALYREYALLKDETAKVEKIKRSVKEILHGETLKQARGMEGGMGGHSEHCACQSRHRKPDRPPLL